MNKNSCLYPPQKRSTVSQRDLPRFLHCFAREIPRSFLHFPKMGFKNESISNFEGNWQEGLNGNAIKSMKSCCFLRSVCFPYLLQGQSISSGGLLCPKVIKASSSRIPSSWRMYVRMCFALCSTRIRQLW